MTTFNKNSKNIKLFDNFKFHQINKQLIIIILLDLRIMVLDIEVDINIVSQFLLNHSILSHIVNVLYDCYTYTISKNETVS